MQFSSIIYLVVAAAFSWNAGVSAQLVAGENAITNPLGGTIDASVPLKITWTPTTNGTITLNLLKGPPANLVDEGPIASKIENTGSFTWNIPNSLQDSSTMPSGNKYGLRIMDDATGTYQYSPPFDISVTDSTFGGTSSTTAAAASSVSQISQTTIASSTQESSTSTIQAETTTSVSSSTPTSETTPAQTPSASSSPPYSTVVSTSTPTPTPTETPQTVSTSIQQSALPVSTSTSASTTGTGTLAASTASNSSTPSNPTSSPQLPVIIGAAAGGFAAIAGIIFAGVLISRSLRRRKTLNEKGFDDAYETIEQNIRNEHMGAGRKRSMEYLDGPDRV
ncbi:hypothetical protein RUND412_009890 [Rhizina undulata]